MRNKRLFFNRRKNLLIVSDLHLGEGLREAVHKGDPQAAGSADRNEYLERLEREFSDFLIHYTAERINGRPWRLIINGDMVDFMSVLLLPGKSRDLAPPEELVAAVRQGGLQGPEEVFGLGTGATHSALKLRRSLSKRLGWGRKLR